MTTATKRTDGDRTAAALGLILDVLEDDLKACKVRVVNEFEQGPEELGRFLATLAMVGAALAREIERGGPPQPAAEAIRELINEARSR